MKIVMFRAFGIRKVLGFVLAFGALFTLPVQAVDTVIVTAFTDAAVLNTAAYQTRGGTISQSGSTALSTAPGLNASRTRAVYGFSNIVATASVVSWSITPTLNVPGALYKIEVAHATATCSPSVRISATCADGNLSALDDTVFDSSHAANAWHTFGYITNHVGVTQPVIIFTNTGGAVGPLSSQNRVYIDGFKFTEVSSCSGVAADIFAVGPLAANQTNVTVIGVDGAATNITVYADGSPIGQRTSGIVAGTNIVTVSALIQGTEIKADQTKSGCVSSRAGAGGIVGGGANPPSVKAFLTCWQSATYTGPIGTNSAPPGSGVYYALKGSGLPSGSQNAPGGGEILAPNQCWQTVTFDHALDSSVRLDNGATAAPYGPFCALDGVAFAIDTPDSGPYDIYIDQIKNGDVLIEDFETYAVDTTNRFNAPKAQPTNPNPVVTYLNGPNSSLISSSNAFDGTKSCRIQWQFNGSAVARWARVQANATPGKNYPQLDTSKPITIRYLILPVGETTNKLHLPTVPVDQTKITNETVTFSVTAAGEGPFTYQWQFAGTDLGGETLSSYTKSNVQLLDAGTYSVTVTGAGGAGCSANTGAKLTVTEFVAPPTITYTWNGSNALQLNWTGTFNLESKTNLSDTTWTSVGVSTGPYNVPLTGAATFYRLHNP